MKSERRWALTENYTLQLAAVIEKAKGHIRVIEGAEIDIVQGRPVMDAAEEKAMALRLLGELVTHADAAAVLAERDAEKWDEGRRAWARYELALEDAAAAGQGHIVSSPVNPYKGASENRSDRWLAEHDAKVLEDAADAIALMGDHLVANVLRERAEWVRRSA